MPSKTNAVSAPGKVLFAGGYLILERAYTGLVLGIDARIHVHVQALKPQVEGVELREIVVKSPQFRNAVWRYGFHYDDKHQSGVKVVQLIPGQVAGQIKPNPFVETALSYALTYVTTVLSDPMAITAAEVTILADNSYYSDSQLLTASHKDTRFGKFDTTIWDAHKTGLGSSAALVTSFTGAILGHYLSKEKFSIETEEGRMRVHNLAQAAHCAAQGKVGSGFDVASAVYGSCIYRRFSPHLLEDLEELGSTGFAPKLRTIVDNTQSPEKWDTEIRKENVTVPKGLRLVLCDVDCGSKTPGMVKKVLEWRRNNPQDAERIWTSLQKNNDDLAAELVKLAREGESSYQTLKEKIDRLRELVQEMSHLSGVEIEPKAQTELLDGCSKIAGVVGGVTPGAGGYDAVSLLIEDRPEVLDELRKLTESWKFRAGEDNTSEPGKVRILNVREEMEGIKEEQSDGKDYTAWFS